jgi:hypothetical protein
LPIVKRSGAPCQRPAHGRRSRLGTVTRSSTPGARTPETPPRRKHQRTTTLTTSRQTAHTQASKTQPHSTRAQHHTPRRPRRNCRVDHRPPNPSSRSTRCAQDLRRQGAPQARDCSDSSSREGHRPQNPLFTPRPPIHSSVAWNRLSGVIGGVTHTPNFALVHS